MSDLIRRKEAIDALAKADAKKGWKTLKFSEMAQSINDIPSAQHWIPCSERLPEDRELVLICADDGEESLAYRELEEWTDDCYRWFSDCCSLGMDISWSEEAIVAWMPLPEPYKEDVE